MELKRAKEQLSKIEHEVIDDNMLIDFKNNPMVKRIQVEGLESGEHYCVISLLDDTSYSCILKK